MPDPETAPSPNAAGEPAGQPAGARSGEPTPRQARWRRIGACLIGIEALVPLIAAGYGLAELLSGESVVQRNETMLVVVLLVVAVGLSIVAVGVARGRRAVRSASLVWQVLLVLGVVPALWQAGGWGPRVCAVAVVAFVAVAGLATVRATEQHVGDAEG